MISRRLNQDQAAKGGRASSRERRCPQENRRKGQAKKKIWSASMKGGGGERFTQKGEIKGKQKSTKGGLGYGTNIRAATWLPGHSEVAPFDALRWLRQGRGRTREPEKYKKENIRDDENPKGKKQRDVVDSGSTATVTAMRSRF